MDRLIRFSFTDAPVRGAYLHLDSAWQAVRERNAVPRVAEHLLGCALAGSGLLVSGLKFQGRLTLQLQGTGPVRLLLAQCQHDGRLRGIVRANETVADAMNFTELTGDGVLVINIEQDQSERRYQGIVPLDGHSLMQALEHYFMQSEQLATRLWLASGRDQVAGLLLQKIPGPGSEENNDGWQRVVKSAEILNPDEMLGASPEGVLCSLFQADTVRLGKVLPLVFGCHCSSHRVAEVLRSLGRAEIVAGLGDEREIAVDCEFCNQRYAFDLIDLERIFVASDLSPSSATTQ